MHVEPFQDTSHPESTDDPANLSHKATNTPTSRSHGISVTSSYAESNQLHSAVAESQMGISELMDIVVKKLSDDKPDNPRPGFYDFLNVEVVQLTSDSYDKFEQETFNLVMRFKCKDKQQQILQHDIGQYGLDRPVQPAVDFTPVSYCSHANTGLTAADATDIHTHTTTMSTAAFTAAVLTDIYSGSGISLTADPWTGSTA